MKQSSTRSHEDIFLLLPWYANRSLDENEQALVSSHLEHCDTCRNELKFLREMETAARQQDEVYTIPQNGLARLQQRIDGAGDRPHVTRRTSASGISKWFDFAWLQPRGLAVALPALLVVAVVSIAFLPGTDDQEPAYRTLTSEQSFAERAARFKVALRDDAKQALLQDYFRQVWDADVAITRTAQGDYVFELPDDADSAQTVRFLQMLKGAEGVESVELVME